MATNSGPNDTMDDVWRRESIESPCVNICVVHPDTRLCVGCARSIDEIAQWARMTPENRADVLADLPNRDAAPKKRRGGRAKRRQT